MFSIQWLSVTMGDIGTDTNYSRLAQRRSSGVTYQRLRSRNSHRLPNNAAMAEWSNAADCKLAYRRFESDWLLQL
jgi:hypothetical protein